MQQVADDIERFAAEHFQTGICLPADCGVRTRAIVSTGRNFIPEAFDEYRREAKASAWWRETSALAKTQFPVIGRPENVAEFRQLLVRRKDHCDKTALLDLLRSLQAERLALEKEFAARSEELLRRDLSYCVIYEHSRGFDSRSGFFYTLPVLLGKTRNQN